MGRRLSAMFAALILLVTMFESYSFADNISADKKRITVQDNVPYFTVYCENYESADTDDSFDIQMNCGQNQIITDVQNIRKFRINDNDEGVTYFMLIDTSVSMNNYTDESFENVKKAAVDFTETRMDSKDKVFLIPFDIKAEYDNKGMNPTTTDLKEKISTLVADGKKSNIYDAIAETVKIAEKIKNDNQYPQRKVAVLFTDACEFNDGGDEATAADVELVSSGITLYAFTIGDRKNEKDKLRAFVLESGGTVFDSKLKTDLNQMQDNIDNSLVIEFCIKNPSDLKGNYNLKVYNENILVGMKLNVIAPNTAGVKDAVSVTVKKTILKYWWIVLIIAIAVIAAIVLIVIRKNKGVVNVEGNVVYGKNLQKKYHIKGNKEPAVQLHLVVRVKGSNAISIEYLLVNSMIIGRASACDVYFDDEKMSRQHFAIELIDGRLYISDLESTSGTYLNGVKVYMKQQLNSGDAITAGTTKIIVEWNR